MRVATAAHHLDPAHAVAAVFFGLHRAFGKRRPEARPSRARFELGVRVEKRIAATNAPERALVVEVPELAREGALRSLLPRHMILLGSQLFLPVLVRFDGFVHG